MPTNHADRKRGASAREVGEEPPAHPPQHVQYHGNANGFVAPQQQQQYQYHHNLHPPMHPLAPPPKRIKPNNGFFSAGQQFEAPDTANKRSHRKVAPPMPQVLPAPVMVRSSLGAAAAGQQQQQRLLDPSKQNPYSTSRGLRHFSMKVCEKVEEKGTTTYNEVADELVRELKQAEQVINAAAAARGEVLPIAPPKASNKNNKKTGKAKKNHDDKNIRRRVYDALNVLMAMDIITKDKKEITWRGLPGNRVDDGSDDGDDAAAGGGCGGGPGKRRDGLSRRQRVQQLQDELTQRQQDIRSKRECLQELMAQNVCFQNLLGRNHAREVEAQRMMRYNSGSAHQGHIQHEYNGGGTTTTFNAGQHTGVVQQNNNSNCEVKEIKDEKIPLPFLIVNTDSEAVVQCEMDSSRTNVSFDFSQPFEINDDNEILKRLGMNHTSKEALQRSLPPDLFHYCDANGLLHSIARSR